MNHLKLLLTRPLQKVSISAAVIVLIVALVGFADSTYLTVEHYRGVIPPCTVVAGCEQVLTSAYATILGVPVALGGAVFYLLVALGAFAYIEGRHERLFRYGLALTVIGFIFTLWFLYVQAFLLKAFCQYCLVSAVTSTLLFVMAVYIFKRYRATL